MFYAIKGKINFKLDKVKRRKLEAVRYVMGANALRQVQWAEALADTRFKDARKVKVDN